MVDPKIPGLCGPPLHSAPETMLLANYLVAAATVLPVQATAETRAFTEEDEDRGKIEWFEGTWEELQEKALATGKLVFLEFWGKSCPYCKRLEEETFRDASVAAEMRDLLCYSVDIGAKQTRPLLKKFGPLGPPTLIFLEPDGSVRDRIGGRFIPPEEFLCEVRRIKRNEGTVSALRKKIEESPGNIAARFELARKLKAIGDIRGYREQVHAIREHDPAGESPESRHLAVIELHKKAQSSLDLTHLYELVDREKEPTILFEALNAIWQLEELLVKIERDEEKRKELRKRSFATARRLWEHVPEERYAAEGNMIAWRFYENREHLSAKDLAWAVKVAEAVVAKVPNHAYAVDTLACCLFAVGRVDEAVAHIRKCIELEPNNPTWRARLKEFTKEVRVAR